jgi:predicted DNA-binding protein
MIRTQIYLPEETHKELTSLAEVKRQPMAQIVRDFIEDGVKRVKEIDNTGITAIENLLKIKATGGPKDLSTNLDHYLYGGPKKKE